MQARHTENVLPSAIGSQPNNASEPAPLAPSQASGRDSHVYFVHQMYGLFGDDKPMSDLFQSSHRMWSYVAEINGAAYHLWNAAEVESLVKQRYPQYWDMYCDVRYPIMRCDIGRWPTTSPEPLRNGAPAS